MPIVFGAGGIGGIGSLIAKGLTITAVEEAEVKMQVTIDEKDDYIKILEDEVDVLQLDAVTTGFKYDMCCAGSPCK